MSSPTPFPFSQQLDAQYCFLSPPEEHHRIMVDLDCSVLFSALGGHPLIPCDFFAHRLHIRYGGSQANWVPVPVRNGFLLKVPDWFSQDDMEGDSPF